MNIQAIKEGFTITENVIGILKSATDKLPPGNKRKEADRLLKAAEEKIKEAEARVGHELGFPVCKRCWPPEIMIHNDDREYICRNCGKPMPDGVSTTEISPADDLSTW